MYVSYSVYSVVYCFHLLIISIRIYINSGSACKKAAILCHQISIVAQNVDLDQHGFYDFYAVITA